MSTSHATHSAIRRGRPSKYTPKVVKAICAASRTGFRNHSLLPSRTFPPKLFASGSGDLLTPFKRRRHAGRCGLFGLSHARDVCRCMTTSFSRNSRPAARRQTAGGCSCSNPRNKCAHAAFTVQTEQMQFSTAFMSGSGNACCLRDAILSRLNHRTL